MPETMSNACASSADAPFNQAKADQFSERLLVMLNQAALALMTSIGHRTGLFDVMATLSPSRSEEIARAAGLNERYVREWLGSVTVGGITEYDPETDAYRLPREHAAFLTRAVTPNNLAVYAQYIPVLGAVEDEIVQCFKRGGGVPYSSFKRFHDVMAEDSGQTVLPVLLESILPLVPGAVEVLLNGIDVLEIGCGQGRALTVLADRFPESRFLGYDLSAEVIREANAGVARRGLKNISFEEKDLTTFEPQRQYDLILAFDAIHDQARPDRVLAGIAKALKPQGTFLMQDIAGSRYIQRNLDHPIGPFLYAISCLHCMTVSLAQNGMGLGAMWGVEKAQEMLAAVGFSHVEIKRLPHDFQNCYFVARK